MINVDRDVKIPNPEALLGKKYRLMPSFWEVTRHFYSLT